MQFALTKCILSAKLSNCTPKFPNNSHIQIVGGTYTQTCVQFNCGWNFCGGDLLLQRGSENVAHSVAMGTIVVRHKICKNSLTWASKFRLSGLIPRCLRYIPIHFVHVQYLVHSLAVAWTVTFMHDCLSYISGCIMFLIMLVTEILNFPCRVLMGGNRQKIQKLGLDKHLNVLQPTQLHL